MPSRLNEFTRFMNEFGPRALDQLAVGRLGASIAAAAAGIPADITPLDGLAAHWSSLSSDEKATFFKRLAAAAPAHSRRKAKSARTAVAGKTAAVAKPKREAKDERAAGGKKSDKKAKKEAKARAKEAKKLRKKEAKAKEKAEKKAKKMAKAAEKKAKAAQLATAPS